MVRCESCCSADDPLFGVLQEHEGKGSRGFAEQHESQLTNSPRLSLSTSIFAAVTTPCSHNVTNWQMAVTKLSWTVTGGTKQIGPSVLGGTPRVFDGCERVTGLSTVL